MIFSICIIQGCFTFDIWSYYQKHHMVFISMFISCLWVVAIWFSFLDNIDITLAFLKLFCLDYKFLNSIFVIMCYWLPLFNNCAYYLMLFNNCVYHFTHRFKTQFDLYKLNAFGIQLVYIDIHQLFKLFWVVICVWFILLSWHSK